MMSTAASLPSVVKPRFIEPVGENQTSEDDACWLRDTPDKGARKCWCAVDVGASSPSSNVEPAHNTTKNFAPNLR
jgi:hypothetical protein